MILKNTMYRIATKRKKKRKVNLVAENEDEKRARKKGRKGESILKV